MSDRIRLVHLHEDEYRRHLEEAATKAARLALEEYALANPPAADPDDLISKREAAAILGISTATLDKLRTPAGDLPWYQVQSNVRFKRSEVLEYAQNRQR